VYAGIITLLVVIYQGHSPSLVCARSQEELEAVLQVLCATPVWLVSPMSRDIDRSDRSTPLIWPVDTGSSSFRGRKYLVGRLIYSPLSGFSTTGSKFVSNHVSNLDCLHMRHMDLYWFGPPRSNTLRPVSSYCVLMPRVFVVGVTNWSGEGVKPKSPWCVEWSVRQPLWRFPSSPFYRRKGEW
jgi:hypothetical protein